MDRWVLMLTLLTLPSLTAAATFHVATTGNDSNPCTAASPCRTASRGASVLSGGDTLMLHSGLYEDGGLQLPDGSAGAHTTIMANPGDTVTLRPGGGDCVICLGDGQHHITIDGLILDSGNEQGDRLGFAPVVNNDHDNATGHDFVIQNCEVRNGKQQGLHIAGGNWLIKNNHIHHNGTDASLHHGLYFAGWESTIDGNTFDHNACTGLQNYSSTGGNTANNTYTNNVFTQNGCGVVIAQSSGHTIQNNLIYDEGTGGKTPGALTCCAPNSTVTNNTIVNNHLTGIASYGGGAQDNVEVRNNLVCGNAGGQIELSGARLDGNVTDCPSFVDAAHGNFRPVDGGNVGATLGGPTLAGTTPPPSGGGAAGASRGGTTRSRTGSPTGALPPPLDLRIIGFK
jgi:parallel beta-helix repeat protein